MVTTDAAPGAAQPDDEEMPAITIETAPRYLLGFPLVVAVTYDNRSKDSEFYRLPQMDLLFSRGEIGVRLVPSHAHSPPRGVALETRFAKVDEPKGLTLVPGQAARLVVDLSNTGERFEPGVYRLALSLTQGRSTRWSNTVDIELAPPSNPEAAEAARLRKLGRATVDTGAWAPFLRDNWNTVAAAPSLGAAAKQGLALHLFLHRAVYGPAPLAAIDPAPLASVTEPSLAAEVEALRYELLAARRDPSAPALRQQMLKTYPGLAMRAEAIDRGDGDLAVMRRSIGAEKRHLKPPPTRPYAP